MQLKKGRDNILIPFFVRMKRYEFRKVDEFY